MLNEVKVVHQSDPGVRKRWFESDFFDLYLWEEAGRIVHMQLCYNRHRHDESAISWREGVGMFHDGVDAEQRVRSPLLESGGAYDAERVNARFLKESAGMPVEIRKFVLARLHEFSLTGPIRRGPPRRLLRREDWQNAPDA